MGNGDFDHNIQSRPFDEKGFEKVFGKRDVFNKPIEERKKQYDKLKTENSGNNHNTK